MESDAIEDRLTPDFGELLARAILARTQQAQREAFTHRAAGRMAAAAEEEYRWRGDVVTLCREALAHMQRVIDEFTRLAVEKAMTEPGPPVLFWPGPDAPA